MNPRLLLASSVLLGLSACKGLSWDRPAILLVTFDTTRADRLSVYGYGRPTTPVLEELAAEGMLFERAYSSAPLTIPSHSTMLTGQFPPTHGVRDNGNFILSEDALLISERLSEAGYSTAAFTSAFPTQARWGFNQGFDVYHDPLERSPTQLDWSDQRTADQVVDDALETLPGLVEDGKPLFAWLHFFDPHWPYSPPEPYASQHEGRPYDGEIAFTDAQFGRFLQWWDEAFPTSLVAVTSDHGEGMGDGGERTHGFLLHDGTMRVPMILRGEGVEKGVVIEDPVGHIDLVPTFLEIAGLPVDAGLIGRDLREGGSDAIYSEAKTGQYSLGLASLSAFTDAEGRFMEGGWQGFYGVHRNRVSVTPKTGVDLVPLAKRMAALTKSLGDEQSRAASLDPETLQQLQALGYIGGDLQSESGEIDPRDVIDVMPLTWRARTAISKRDFDEAEKMLERLEARLPGTFGVDLLSAQLLRTKGEEDAALESYLDLYLRSPGGTLALHLAEIHARRGQWEIAEDWFQTTLQHHPLSPEAMAGLVRSALAQEQVQKAGLMAGQFLEAYPDHSELVVILARLEAENGRPTREGLTGAKHALERLPQSPWAHAQVAVVAWELGESELAIDLLKEALRIDPQAWAMRLQLSRMLLEGGRAAEASRLLAPAMRSVPDLPGIRELSELATMQVEAQRKRSTAE